MKKILVLLLILSTIFCYSSVVLERFGWNIPSMIEATQYPVALAGFISGLIYVTHDMLTS